MSRRQSPHPTVDSILKPKDVPTQKTPLSSQELSDLERQELEAQIDQTRSDTKAREKYAPWIFGLVVCWLLAVVGIVLLQGFSPQGFSLANSVLISFITSTTASVVSLFIIVAKYLFSNR